MLKILKFQLFFKTLMNKTVFSVVIFDKWNYRLHLLYAIYKKTKAH